MKLGSIFDAAGGKKPDIPRPLTRDETEAGVKKAIQDFENARRALEELYHRVGVTPEQMEQFLAHPDQFNAKQKMIVARLEEKRKRFFGKQTPESRKKKTISGRRGWMSM